MPRKRRTPQGKPDITKVVRINDASELDKFTTNLRRAARNSQQKGGCYSTFLLAEGERIQFEVQFPWLKQRG